MKKFSIHTPNGVFFFEGFLVVQDESYEAIAEIPDLDNFEYPYYWPRDQDIPEDYEPQGSNRYVFCNLFSKWEILYGLPHTYLP